MNIFKDGNHFESANLFCWRTVLLEIEVCHLFFFKHIRKLCTHLSCLAPKNVTSGRTIPRWLSSFARRHKKTQYFVYFLSLNVQILQLDLSCLAIQNCKRWQVSLSYRFWNIKPTNLKKGGWKNENIQMTFKNLFDAWTLLR